MSDSAERRIANLEARLAQLQAELSRLTGPFPRLLLAKDGANEGHFQEQTINDGSVVEFTTGRVSDVDDDPSNVIDPAEDGAYFLVEFDDFADGAAVKRFVKVASSGGMFPVTLSQTGGINGDNLTAATWTYDASDTLTGKALGSGFSPTWPRPLGTMTAATDGAGYFDADGNFVLDIAYEKPGAAGCPTPP